MNFKDAHNVVFPIGRVTQHGINLLGTGFLTATGKLVTAAHVTANDDTDLIVILPNIHSFDAYQDTTDGKVNGVAVKISAIDPFRDLCVLTIRDGSGTSNLVLGSADDVYPGDSIVTLGYPHADYGRKVLTAHQTGVGARVLIGSGPIKSKHLILNIQARPGQSGSPVIRASDGRVVAILIGSYAPSGCGGVIVGDIDPATLHQTTHAVSAEYLKEMLR